MVSNVVHLRFTDCVLEDVLRAVLASTIAVPKNGPTRDFTVEFDRSTLRLVARPWPEVTSSLNQTGSHLQPGESLATPIYYNYPSSQRQEKLLPDGDAGLSGTKLDKAWAGVDSPTYDAR